jgi:hypothetical protein
LGFSECAGHDSQGFLLFSSEFIDNSFADFILSSSERNPYEGWERCLQRRALQMNNDIEHLFRTREEAVRKQDRPLFLSTQVSSEIVFGSSDGYLSLEDITTEVINIYDESELEKVVFVKETYKQPDTNPRSSFLVYFLTNTVQGWRIYRVR